MYTTGGGGNNKYRRSPVVVVHKSAGRFDRTGTGGKRARVPTTGRPDPSETRRLKTRVHKHGRALTVGFYSPKRPRAGPPVSEIIKTSGRTELNFPSSPAPNFPSSPNFMYLSTPPSVFNDSEGRGRQLNAIAAKHETSVRRFCCSSTNQSANPLGIAP